MATMTAVSVFLGFLAIFASVFYYLTWWKPEARRAKLRAQGIRGPHPVLLLGNIPEMKRIQTEARIKYSDPLVGSDYGDFVFPYFHKWRKEYGATFIYSTGSIQFLYAGHPDIVREIGKYKSLDLGKPTYLQKDRKPIFGSGILTANGGVWAHQRKTIAPEFFMDKVKGMVSLIQNATFPLLETWESKIGCEGETREIIVDEDLKNLSADVISQACFGSNYSKGREIFSKLHDLQKLISKGGLLIGVPGMRYLPTPRNIKLYMLEKDIRLSILSVVKERQEKRADLQEKDLLQSILENATGDHFSSEAIESFIVDNCKNIYFAGHDTVAASASWCLMLLAKYPEWQTRTRVEVKELCQGKLLDFEVLRKMKTLTMVIQETLRLYSPGVSSTREALEDLKLGNVFIPKGTNIFVPISVMHHNQDMWGPDADEFRPERFAQGISSACKLPHAYIPFGTGARTCLGQNLAMVELKIVLSLILSKFNFSLSPNYRHSPAFRLTIQPEYGVRLNMKKI